MSTRKFESIWSKRKRKERVEFSRKQTLNKDIIIEEKFNENDNRNNTIKEKHYLMNEQVSTDTDNESFSLDLIDSTNWGDINTNLRDLIVMKGPAKGNDIIFSKDVANRHFSYANYVTPIT